MESRERRLVNKVIFAKKTQPWTIEARQIQAAFLNFFPQRKKYSVVCESFSVLFEDACAVASNVRLSSGVIVSPQYPIANRFLTMIPSHMLVVAVGTTWKSRAAVTGTICILEVCLWKPNTCVPRRSMITPSYICQSTELLEHCMIETQSLLKYDSVKSCYLLPVPRC
jgi:hypothetical protein